MIERIAFEESQGNLREWPVERVRQKLHHRVTEYVAKYLDFIGGFDEVHTHTNSYYGRSFEDYVKLEMDVFGSYRWSPVCIEIKTGRDDGVGRKKRDFYGEFGASGFFFLGDYDMSSRRTRFHYLSRESCERLPVGRSGLMMPRMIKVPEEDEILELEERLGMDEERRVA